MSDKKHICKFCGSEWTTYQKLGGHIVNCSLNPILEQRRENMRKGHLGKKHDKKTTEKISKTLKEYVKTKRKFKKLGNEEIYKGTVFTDEKEKIDMIFYGDDL